MKSAQRIPEINESSNLDEVKSIVHNAISFDEMQTIWYISLQWADTSVVALRYETELIIRGRSRVVIIGRQVAKRTMFRKRQKLQFFKERDR